MKISKLLSFLFLSVVFVGVIAKVIHVPITHDESWTITRYTPYSIWSIMMYPDSWPNNHILNTIGTKIFAFIGGYNHISVRLTSLIAFIIYAFAAVKISQFVSRKNAFGVLFMLILFFGNPFFNEFFSLCRGYALSNAFILLSAFMFLKAVGKNNIRSLWYAVLFGSLAAYANFTALIYWAACIALALIILLTVYKSSKYPIWKSVATLAIAVISFLALIITPIIKMRKDNQFEYWSSNGFFKDTVLSSTEKWRLGAKLFYEFDRAYLGYFVVFVFLLMLCYLLYIFYKSLTQKKFVWSPFVVAFSLLSLTIIINILQTTILNTPNLIGRTAQLYYPLFIFSIVSFITEFFQGNKFNLIVMNILLTTSALFSGIHLIDRYNYTHVHEWWYDQNNIEVIQYLKQVEEPVQLKTHWMFHPSFNYYDWVGKSEHIKLLEYDKNISPSPKANYYYVFESDIKALEGEYEKHKKFGWDRWLMKKIN